MGLSCVDVEVAAGEQLLQRQSVAGRVRVQREGRDAQVDVVLGSDSFCTDRTEVAPRSYVVGEDFEGYGGIVAILTSLADWFHPSAG